MTEKSIGTITGYHAHVYFDADSEDDAKALREAIARRFDMTLGSWHHKPVGPHPRSMYLVTFTPVQFADFVPWLALNRRGLTIFLHPESGDVVADHLDHALWMGEVLELDAGFLEDFAARNA